VIKIQELQAKEKKVQILSTFHGFPSIGSASLKVQGRKASLNGHAPPIDESQNTRVFMDEKRFQQVLLNY